MIFLENFVQNNEKQLIWNRFQDTFSNFFIYIIYLRKYLVKSFRKKNFKESVVEILFVYQHV